jgi:hypothetical protein
MSHFKTLPNGLKAPLGTQLVTLHFDGSINFYRQEKQVVLYWFKDKKEWIPTHLHSLTCIYDIPSITIWIDEDVLESLMGTNQIKETSKVPSKPTIAKDASELCLKASELLAERGKQYDGSGKERSMASTVAAFNAVYGTNLTEQQGWHFMILLKMVRQRAGGHIDSAEDLIAYAALAAENTHATLS